jgi:hypothetical protein
MDEQTNRWINRQMDGKQSLEEWSSARQTDFEGLNVKNKPFC